jgi:hypothetical protein
MSQVEDPPQEFSQSIASLVRGMPASTDRPGKPSRQELSVGRSSEVNRSKPKLVAQNPHGRGGGLITKLLVQK